MCENCKNETTSISAQTDAVVPIFAALIQGWATRHETLIPDEISAMLATRAVELYDDLWNTVAKQYQLPL